LREGNNLGNIGVDGRVIILKWVFKKGDGDMDRIDQAQARGMWRAFVKAVMNLQFLWNNGSFLTR